MRIGQACHDLAWTKDQGVLAFCLVVREVEKAVHDFRIVLLGGPLLGLVSKLEF